jgi:hypothetical protein
MLDFLGYYFTFGLFAVGPCFLLTLPAFYYLLKRNLFSWFDVAIFFYGYSLWWLISRFVHKSKSLSNAAIEPMIISLTILIITYLRIFVPIKFLPVILRVFIVSFVALLVYFSVPILRE